MTKKYVYSFTEGSGSMKALLGGKGANLAEMVRLGLPVPSGFVISTEACSRYYEDNQTLHPQIVEEIFSALNQLQRETGKEFGSLTNPLLVSVRSGSRASMPGMMDTILNLGINDDVATCLAKKTGNSRFAYDSYRRFIQMFADVVMEVPKAQFEAIIDEMKKQRDIVLDTEFTTEDLQEMVLRFKQCYQLYKGTNFPDNPKTQLIEAVKAVFRSWNNPRAIYYRRINDIPASWGTAVNIQSMVYGNMGDDCGTGVAFTRNPATGEKEVFGEFLMNAQGEDVVAGIRTPYPIAKLLEMMPDIYQEFIQHCHTLEQHYHDMQDMEFTIENKKLYLLQTRNGKRTATAALKIAVDLVAEGLISKEEALLQINPKQLDALLHPRFDQEALQKATIIGQGLPASPGAACGKAVFTAADAVAWKQKGEKVVLIRLETSPEDIEGMDVAEGFLTARGGMTSHAAVVARGMGKCCVSGCQTLTFIDEKTCQIQNAIIKEGDYVSLDGTTGNVYGEAIMTVTAEISGDFETIMNWSDGIKTLGIRANADTAKDAKQALSFGAEGIGLVRTEHMFFDTNRIKLMREMILSNTQQQRQKALQQLLPIQRQDFEEIYEVMAGKPVTIRYLDPPLHEFLPTKESDILALAQEMNIDVLSLKNVIDSLHEFNPMMGHRGCRLAISYPEIAQMQTQAIIQAAINVKKRHPQWENVVEIMIPLVGEKLELKYVKELVEATADALISQNQVALEYKIGTMIEVPRAALLADEIAQEAAFFSFGTNDLTQLTFGFSRDDAASFLNHYYTKGIYELDPFARLDQAGVGKLVTMAVQLGRQANPHLKLGICGEHGGDPSSIDFFHQAGLDYVSCSPYRVPIARLAAAQAVIKRKA